ncbi:MAG: bifunctional nuclease family protein [Candidatus Aenigmatarchaeota archaeon]|nr:MAG: bifunctional nuclease family protein [Candidatus Aenigmarchaeota archaeon]
MKILIGIAILLIGVLIGIYVAGFSPIGMVIYEGKQNLTYEELVNIPQLSIDGFSRASIDVDEDQIYLFSGCRRLSMVTNEFQTKSIKDGLEGVMGFRPTTHDIMRNVLDAFDMKPIMVKITDLRENAYFARLFVVQGRRILNLDSRPSDAIAIAVRTATPVYVNQTLMEEQGEKVC